MGKLKKRLSKYKTHFRCYYHGWIPKEEALKREIKDGAIEYRCPRNLKGRVCYKVLRTSSRMKKILWKSKRYVRPVIYIETDEKEETDEELEDFFSNNGEGNPRT